MVMHLRRRLPACGLNCSPQRSEEINKPRNVRQLAPATARHEINLGIAIARLKDARDYAKLAQCPATLKKIRSAIKSAEGARRHMSRRRAHQGGGT